MKNYASLILILCSIIIFSCADNKKETHKEINIEKKKINDSLVRATVITKYTKGKEVTEEVQVIEGTAEDVNSQLEVYKRKS